MALGRTSAFRHLADGRYPPNSVVRLCLINYLEADVPSFRIGSTVTGAAACRMSGKWQGPEVWFWRETVVRVQARGA